MRGEISLDELQEARRILFQFAEAKYTKKTQHGDEQPCTQGMGTTDKLILKSRRSIEATVDDIIELYQYLNDDRNKFPRACLSSSKFKLSHMESIVKDGNEIGKSTPYSSSTSNDAQVLNTHSDFMELKLLIEDLRSEVMSMKAQFVENLDLKLQIQTLESDKASLHSAIEVLSNEKQHRKQSIATASPTTFDHSKTELLASCCSVFRLAETRSRGVN